MERDYKHDTSHIQLSITSSNGTYLNGSNIPQRRFAHISINSPKREKIVDVYLTLDQLASFLVSNSTVTSTLRLYRGPDGEMHEEKVKRPESVGDRMTKRMGKSHESITKRISDARQDLYEMVNGGKKGVKQLKELLSDLETIESHFTSNQKFVVKQAQEEVEDMQENMRAQISNAFPQLNLSSDNIKILENQKQDFLKLESPDVETPVVEDYIPKERNPKKIEDMTMLELADELHQELRRLEYIEHSQPDYGDADAGRTRLFGSGAVESGKYIKLRYISYQGQSSISKETGQKLLAHLRTCDDPKKMKRHYDFEK